MVAHELLERSSSVLTAAGPHLTAAGAATSAAHAGLRAAASALSAQHNSSAGSLPASQIPLPSEGIPAAVAAQQHLLSSNGAPDLAPLLLAMAEEQPMWLLGMGLMVIGTIASSTGMLMLKRASVGQGPPWYRNPWFWGGIFLFAVTAALVDLIVFAVTPLSLIAPFAGLTIVVSFSLASMGCCGVREAPTRTAATAVAIIVTGVTIDSIFGPKANGELNPPGLEDIYDHSPFLLWAAMGGGPLFGLFALLMKFDLGFRKWVRSAVGALVLAVLAACYGALTQLQFKAFASAVVAVVGALYSGTEYSKQYATPAEGVRQVFALASGGIAQIGFLNYAISVAPVAYSVPAYQAALLLTTLGIAGWVLGDFMTLPTSHIVMYTIGSALVMLGMMLNAFGLHHATKRGDASDLEAPGRAAKKAPWEEQYAGEGGEGEAARAAAAAKFTD